MKKRKVRYGTVQFDNKIYKAEFLQALTDVLVQPVSEKIVNIYKLNGKLVGQAVQEEFQKGEDMKQFGRFHKLSDVKTEDLIKELSGRPGTTTIRNKSDQQLKVTAGEKSRVKEKCDATVVIVRSA